MSLPPFEQIVADHGGTVLRVCRALAGVADADDAWSETFIAALRAYPDMPAGTNIRAWLVRVAHNKAVDEVRRAGRAPRTQAVLPDGPSPEGIPEPPDEDLRTALTGLTRRQRAAVVYHHVAGMTFAEVGALLGSSESAARRSAADGIAKLRRTYPEVTR